VLHANTEEAYQIILYEEHRNGAWRPINFIVEQGTINFVLQPMDKWGNNLVEGGKHTNEYQTIGKKIYSEIKNTIIRKIKQIYFSV
jgi:hypothetical protein